MMGKATAFHLEVGTLGESLPERMDHYDTRGAAVAALREFAMAIGAEYVGSIYRGRIEFTESFYSNTPDQYAMIDPCAGSCKSIQGASEPIDWQVCPDCERPFDMSNDVDYGEWWDHDCSALWL